LASFVFFKGKANLVCAITVDIEHTDKAQRTFGGKILCVRLLFTVGLGGDISSHLLPINHVQSHLLR
jgi:hypothetical protein